MTSPSKSRAKSSPSTCSASGLSFSIEKILGKTTSGKDRMAPCDDSSRDCAPISAPERDKSQPRATSPLPWLAYSRYCPPKIPRSRRRQNCKRKSSGNPRVPFSTKQILKLEEKFSQGRYVSASEVAKISEELDLAQHRIKIWFQNRRARQKRTENEKNCPIGESS